MGIRNPVVRMIPSPARNPEDWLADFSTEKYFDKLFELAPVLVKPLPKGMALGPFADLYKHNSVCLCFWKSLVLIRQLVFFILWLPLKGNS